MAFDGEILRGKMLPISPAYRCAFALLCAERWLPNFDRVHGLADGRVAHRLVETLWEHVVGAEPLGPAELNAASEGAEALIVTDEELHDRYGDHVGDDLPGAQAAIASVAYAVRAILTGDPQEAVWAAQCSYDTADADAQRTLGHDASEAALLASSFVQNELGYQEADLVALANAERSALNVLRARNRVRTKDC